MDDSRFRLDARTARELVRQFGTPLYVVDEATFRARIRRYRAALQASHPRTQLCYASKANSTLALVAIADQEGCLIDVASEGEFRAALAAGVPASRCNFHGNNKTREELAVAMERGIGEIIVDNAEELRRIGELASSDLPVPSLLLRLAPGVDPITHEKISTGQEDSKFGFNIANGEAERGVQLALSLGLAVSGFHAHVGSQLFDAEAQCVSGERIAQFAAEMHARHGVETTLLNVGGGFAAKYLDEHHVEPIETYTAEVARRVQAALSGSGLDPVLLHEPGRALVCEAGLTLYTVGNLKTVQRADGSDRTYVAVDGGLSDNPRPALYDARYSVERACRAHADEEWEYVTDGPGAAFAGPVGTRTVTVAGKHCETDNLFVDVELPSDLQPGDVLQVLSTGAYNSSMASNYNRYPRPATVLLREGGEAALIQRRETWDEMFARECLIEEVTP